MFWANVLSLLLYRSNVTCNHYSKAKSSHQHLYASSSGNPDRLNFEHISVIRPYIRNPAVYRPYIRKKISLLVGFKILPAIIKVINGQSFMLQNFFFVYFFVFVIRLVNTFGHCNSACKILVWQINWEKSCIEKDLLTWTASVSDAFHDITSKSFFGWFYFPVQALIYLKISPHHGHTGYLCLD